MVEDSSPHDEMKGTRQHVKVSHGIVLLQSGLLLLLNVRVAGLLLLLSDGIGRGMWHSELVLIWMGRRYWVAEGSGLGLESRSFMVLSDG